MKSQTVSEINVDVDTANGNDAVADTATGTQSVAGIEGAAGTESIAADVTDVATAADPGAADAQTAAVRILKTANCPSLSGKSILKYSIGANSAGEIGFCITANSGGGLFNREWVPAASIKALTDTIPKGLPVRASTFAPVFQGKSTNTPGFLLADLLSEGLLRPLADKARCYELCDPTAFIAEVNGLLETPVDVVAPDKPKPVKKPTLSLKSKSKKVA